MGPFRSAHRHGPPLLGRVQETSLFPDVIARMQPSDSLLPSATAPVPLASSLPRGGRLFCASCGRRHVRSQTCRASETGHRLSATPVLSARRSEGLPGCEAILFVRAVVEHPAGYGPLLAQHAGSHYCLRCHPALSASGKTIGFGAAVPRPARSRTYASPMAFLPPSQGWLPARAGSPLAGRVSHPLDDRQNFMKASHPPIPIDPQGLVALNE